MVGFGCAVVIDKVGRTVVGIVEDWVVGVEEAVVEVLVLDEGEVESVEEAVVVLDGETVVLGPEPDGDIGIVEVAVGCTLGMSEVDCGGELDMETAVVVLGFWPPPTPGAAEVADESAFGHSVDTPFPIKNIPINVLG